MAKLKAPLLSLGASGAIGKAIVFFPWKGLNVAREFVVPANPNTATQQAQRGLLRDAVSDIHWCQAQAAPMVETDVSAYALLGSCEPSPRTWFNTIVKGYIDQLKDALDYCIFFRPTITPGVDQITLMLAAYKSTGFGITAGYIYYGTSKTALVNSIACSHGDLQGGKAIPGLTTGVKYFMQYRPTEPVDYLGTRSGIYYAVAG